MMYNLFVLIHTKLFWGPGDGFWGPGDEQQFDAAAVAVLNVWLFVRGVVARLFKKMPQPCRLIGLEVHFNLDLRVRGAKGHQILGIEDVVFAPLAVNFKHGRPFCRNLTQAMPCQGLFVEGEPRHRPARRSASVVVHLDRAVEAFVHVVLVAELVVGAHAGNKVVFSRRAQPLAPVALTADP